MSVTNIYISKNLYFEVDFVNIVLFIISEMLILYSQMHLILTDHNFVRIKQFTTFTNVYHPGHVK